MNKELILILSFFVSFFLLPSVNHVHAIQRPTLFVNQQQVVDLKNKIQNTHSSVWLDVKARADSKLNTNPANYRLDVSSQLWQRDVGSFIAQFAFVGLISGEQKYFDAAAAWARAACNYPTWGVDATSDGAEYGLEYGHQLLGLAMLYDYSEGYLCDNMRLLIKNTLIDRTTRQYNAYQVYNYPYLQNHAWINTCGMLAAGIAVLPEYPQAQSWIDFTQQYFLNVSKVLSPDGASQEGTGYWTYGMEFLMLDFYLSKQYLNKDYYTNSDWWKNTAQYGMYLMTPRNTWTTSLNIVDLGDAPRYAWYGPEHIFRELARLNNDPVSQWFAFENNTANTNYSHWFNLLSYNPGLASTSPALLPTMKYFANMGIVSARSDWSGSESMIIFKSGAPMGLLMNSEADSLKNAADLGHVHPDANHFVIFANGEFLVKNNGYVQRQTKYHNTLLIDNKGQWGEVTGYFNPWPLTASRNPKIVSAVSTTKKDVMIGDASGAYFDVSNLKTFIRKLIFIKPTVLVVIDDIELTASHNSVLNFYPEFDLTQSTNNLNIFTSTSVNNKLRVENLTPTEGVASLTTQGITARDGSNTTSTQLLKISFTKLMFRQITAFSWCKSTETEPAIVTLSGSGATQQIVVNGSSYPVN